MSREHNSQTPENLCRWQRSGCPRRWVEAHRGRWGHDDWLALLDGLRRSPYWPLDPDAVGRLLEENKTRLHNLRRWERSGLARTWVEARRGRWNHDDWVALLDGLRRSPYWPLDPEAIGVVLEEIQEEWRNLRRWEESGQARRWVEDRRGRWGLEDWSVLLATLQRSEFWPVDPSAAEGVLKRLTAEWWNLRRWQESGLPQQWVEAHRGQWGHAEWQALLETLRRSQFWPLDPDAVGAVLEEAKRRYGNLRRWQESGWPEHWVAAHQGRWTRDDWLALLDDLRRSEFWPVEPEAAEMVLEQMQSHSGNLRRWQESGRAWQWLEVQQGRWSHADWVALLDELRRSELWPLDPEALAAVMQQLNLEWWNVRRWRASGLARRWVEAHGGEWDHDDWTALLADLRASEFWPADPSAIARVLDEVKAEWANLRRWRGSGQPQQWIEAHHGRWTCKDLLALLADLEESEYGPLDLVAAGHLLEELRSEDEGLRACA